METKRFYLTSEWWASVALTIANLTGGLNLHGRAKGIVEAIIVGAYAMSRGLAKSGTWPTVVGKPDEDETPSDAVADAGGIPPDEGDIGKGAVIQ